MALARALGVPFVVTFHGADATVNPESSLKTRRGRELSRAKHAVIREASAFIAVSDHIRSRLMEQGYPEDKVVVLRNGIDVDFFKPTSSGERDPVILFVGRFVQKKGATYLLEAAQRLMAAGVRFELVMLGSGPLEDELREAATQSGLPCRFPGFMPLTGVMEWLQKARVVVVPSVTADNGDQEGLPTILLEAQAMETPIVATRHSGIPEGVDENVTAYLVDEKDTAGLADKLRIYLENPELARGAGVAGREFVLRNFDMRDQVRELENLYDRLQREYFETGPPQGIRD
jgi:glycosyltransferase involved in cell wall biosynthesis